MGDGKHLITVEANGPSRESLDEVVQLVLHHLWSRNQADPVQDGIHFLGMSSDSSSQKDRVSPSQSSQEEKDSNSDSMNRSQE